LSSHKPLLPLLHKPLLLLLLLLLLGCRSKWVWHPRCACCAHACLPGP
jgi:hypothetical protein